MQLALARAAALAGLLFPGAAQGEEAEPPAPAAPLALDAPASASKGAVGIHVGIIANQVPLYSPVPGATENSPQQVGTVGLTYFVNDRLALLGDLGLGVALAGGEPRLGFKLGAGADYHFRSSAEALRPILYASSPSGEGRRTIRRAMGRSYPRWKGRSAEAQPTSSEGTSR